MKKRVPLICIHNSARSQMAEAWLNYICGDTFEAESAGLEPGTLNPLAVEVMREVGIDISKKRDAGSLRRLQVGQALCLRRSRCAMRPALRSAPSSPGRHNECIGAFPILRRSAERRRKSWKRSGRFAMRFVARWKSGAGRFAPGTTAVKRVEARPDLPAWP